MTPHPSPAGLQDDVAMILERMLDGDEPEKFVGKFAAEIVALCVSAAGPTDASPLAQDARKSSDVEGVVERLEKALDRADELGMERVLFGTRGPGLLLSDLRDLVDERSERAAKFRELEGERDEWKERAGFLWTAPDVDMWGILAEQKGLKLREKINGLLRRAMRAEEAHRTAEAALAEAQSGREAAPPEGWRPIESAPRDGTKLDLWVPGCGRLADRFWSERGSIIQGGWGHREIRHRRWVTMVETEVRPTHWMPLPGPPLPSADARSGEGE